MVAPKRPVKGRPRIKHEEIQAVRSCVLENRDSKLGALKLLKKVARLTRIRPNRVITIVYSRLVPTDTYFNSVWEARKSGTQVPFPGESAVTSIDGYLEQVMESYSKLVHETETLRSQLDTVEANLREQGEWVATLEVDNVEQRSKIMELEKLVADGPRVTPATDRFRKWAESKFGKTLTQ